VKLFFIFNSLEPGLPTAATIAGRDQQAKSTHRIPALFIFEPDAEQRKRWTRNVVHLYTLQTRLGLGVTLLDSSVVIVREQRLGLPAIQLLFPREAAIGTVQDDAIMPNRPAALSGGEVNGNQITLNRNRALLPSFALIFRGHDQPSRANCDQPITRARHRMYGSMCHLGHGDRWNIKRVCKARLDRRQPHAANNKRYPGCRMFGTSTDGHEQTGNR